MLTEQLNLFDWDADELFLEIKQLFPFVSYDFEKHVVLLESKENEKIAYLRLPLHLSLSSDLEVLDNDLTVLYLTIESGNAAICVQEGLDNIYHTTFSAYMTRKKQGFSQVKYLNKKGKSRAGSRIRLSSTIEFFEGINTILNELFEESFIDRIAISCTPTLLPYLYDSKVECPFDKNDERLYKIPLHIPQSNYTNLTSVIKKLRAPVLFYDKKYESLCRKLER